MMLAPLKPTDNDDNGPDAVMRIWCGCAPARASHPYLARHGLPPGALRVWKGALIAPLRDCMDRFVGLLIVDADGAMQSWLPEGGSAHFAIGTPGDTLIIAVTDLADALALHQISGHRVVLATSVEDALALKAHLADTFQVGRILIAGLDMAEASRLLSPGAWSDAFILRPMSASWASMRLKSNVTAWRWIDDPILVFAGVTEASFGWLRRSGLWMVGQEGGMIKVCGPVMATAMTRTDRGEDWSRKIWLIDRDGVEQTLRISERDLITGWQRVVGRLVDAGLVIHDTMNMATIAQHLRSTVIEARLRLVERSGWHEGHYLAPNGTVGPASGDVPVREGRLHMAPASNGDELARWQNEVSALAEGNSRLVLALCAAVAGLAIGLLDGQASFGVHINGLSSTGKSTALAAAASVYGPASREVATWRSTDNGIEAMAGRHNHRLLILDELAQIDPRAAAQIGYTLGNGQGKQRANSSGRSAASSSWQLVFLSAGEISLEQKIAEWAGAPAMREGQVVRVMDLPADGGCGHGLFDVLHGFANGAALSDHFKTVASRSTGDAALALIERLARNTVSARRSLREAQARFLDDCITVDTDGLTRRAFGNFALLAAAGEVAIELGILPWPRGHASAQLARCARDWAEARRDSQRPDALAQVRDWLDRNANSLVPWETANEDMASALGYLRKEPLTFLLRPKGWQLLCESGHDIPTVLTEAGLVRNDPARLPGGKLVRFRIIDGRILDHAVGRAWL